MCTLTEHEQALLRYYNNEWRNVPINVIRCTAREIRESINRVGPTDQGYVPMFLRERALLEYADLWEKSLQFAEKREQNKCNE